LQAGLQQSSVRMAAGQQWTRRTLVVAEVAIALVLLVSAGLLLRSLQHLFAIDPGFDSSHVITMQVQESGHRFDTDPARAEFFRQALEAVSHVPGVETAAFTSQLPLSGDFDSYGVQFESDQSDNADAGLRYAVSPDYFKVLHIPLRRGRLLDEHDVAGAPLAVLLSESFAKRKFPGQDPLGKRLRLGPDIGHADRPWATVVGVVGDVKQASLALGEPNAFYTSTSQWTWVDRAQSLVVRTRGDAASVTSAIKNAIWSVDRDQPIVRVATMDSLLLTSEAERHTRRTGRDPAEHSRAGDSPRHDADGYWRTDRAFGGSRRESRADHAIVWGVAVRSVYVSGSDLPARGRSWHRRRLARMARRTGRSGEHLALGIAFETRLF
jgi:putative ABC transport system permease protein